MPTVLIYSLLAVLGGVLVAAQGPIYARLAEGLGRDYLLSVFLAFLSAALVSGLLTLASGSFRTLTFEALGQLPRWVWLGGMIGAMHVVISMQSIPVLGVTVFLVLVVTGNLVGAAIFDHFEAFGLKERPFTLATGLGMGLVILGVAVLAKTQNH